MQLKSILAATFTAALFLSTQAQAQYSFSEDFEGGALPGALPVGGDAWIATFFNTGKYGNNDTGNLGMDYSVPSPPEFIPENSDGGYLNFYARYDDAGITYTDLMRNIGGFGGGDFGSANDGEHTLTACVYVRSVADGGADWAAGVDGGLGVRVSGVSYSQWPGDTGFTASQSVSSVPRNQWTRVSLTFTVASQSRMDAGVWVTNPTLTVPYVKTGVFYDSMWLGASADAPSTACGGFEVPGPAGIPVLPFWALFGLAGLVGLMGLRRKV
ncbi:MAG: hypothetical protein P8M13_02240 [Luminiphilus sp.]|nr:hypothetical protein [Luminiphilus sp.]